MARKYHINESVRVELVNGIEVDGVIEDACWEHGRYVYSIWTEYGTRAKKWYYEHEINQEDEEYE